MKVLIESQYFPSVLYFATFLKSDHFTLESKEKFQKQSFRNRCILANASATQSLIVPIEHATRHLPIDQLKIDYSENWMHQHWKSIQTVYGKAPFFDFYGEDIKSLIYSREAHLFELNKNILTKCLDWVGLDRGKIDFTNEYEKHPDSPILDLRSCIHPKKSFPVLKEINYNQHFGNEFVFNMSVLDLILCEGPAAGTILKAQSEVLHLNQDEH